MLGPLISTNAGQKIKNRTWHYFYGGPQQRENNHIPHANNYSPQPVGFENLWPFLLSPFHHFLSRRKCFSVLSGGISEGIAQGFCSLEKHIENTKKGFVAYSPLLHVDLPASDIQVSQTLNHCFYTMFVKDGLDGKKNARHIRGWHENSLFYGQPLNQV